ncbi:MAG TPA: DNA polymerase III subunit gamma/tau [Vicinamibacterales bacterium]|nr:DNA polymerase III subunit gamma/tau [Vicinamibacterales bacterium]
MSFQVLARKWRPQQFDDVVGQPAVTRTLANAIKSGRIAQSFVFAGPRGVGKTTTARILARALSCEKGPTADPCGKCDACREIAEGRDIDVLEIDAATHTQVDNVREVIIAGLSIMPVRNRYKVFIIDEVHQLSNHSFNALLKSIEEPPPHVIFMMATTELSKIPETVLSRSQVYEFKTISSKQIADQLRTIATAEKLKVEDAALLLIARAAEGSMRDAQSALDQVIAFAGQKISSEDVATVLGLVGRDLVLDIVTAVADETPAAAFELSGRAVELGYDLRSVVRELARVVRDLLVLSVDPSRIGDPEIAAESERDRMKALAQRFSREDLLRSFDLLSKAEFEIRNATQPRYHLEMALLRWIHLRKLVPLAELLAGIGDVRRPGSVDPAPGGSKKQDPPYVPPRAAPVVPPVARRPSPVAPPDDAVRRPGPVDPASPGEGARDAFLMEIRKSKVFFYNTVVAQAQKIEFGPDRVTFTFLPAHRTLREQLDQNRQWLEQIASAVAGKKISVGAAQAEGTAVPASAEAVIAGPVVAAAQSKMADLKTTAMGDSAVQAMLDVFPAEIENVEEIDE